MRQTGSIGQASVSKPWDVRPTKNVEMSPIIVWFRQDLRLGDNPALRAAAATGAPILPLFVLDDETTGDWRWGGASRWCLHHSLASLNESFADHLVLRRGEAAKIVKTLAKQAK